MGLTPLDIHNKEFSRSFRGYSEIEVDEFLDEVIRTFERLLSENASLREDLDRNKERLSQYQTMENTLKDALLMAQETAEDVRAAARQEARVIIAEGQQKADGVLERARQKAHAIQEQYRSIQKEAYLFRIRMKGMLQAQLEMLTDDEKLLEAPTDDSEEDAASALEQESVPSNSGDDGAGPQDTRRFTVFNHDDSEDEENDADNDWSIG